MNSSDAWDCQEMSSGPVSDKESLCPPSLSSTSERFISRPCPSTPRLSRLSSLPRRFLYENPPIGSQAPLSDTIHCTRADMKSVLTSGRPVILFFLCGGTRHSNARRTSCDQIKVGEEPRGADFNVLVRRLVGFKFLSRCFALPTSIGNLDLETLQ